MTCNRVRGLIDAGPFADYPPPEVEAAWRHAGKCAACGRALAVSTSLAADLMALPRPMPPPDLSATVMARIARLDAAAADSVPARRSAAWPAAAAIVTGGAAAGVAVAVGLQGSITDASALRDLVGVPLAAPASPEGALALLAALGLYVAGLFGPFGRGGAARSR